MRRPFKALALTVALFLGLFAVFTFSSSTWGFFAFGPVLIYVIWMATRGAPPKDFKD
jgi:hypothetical protein